VHISPLIARDDIRAVSDYTSTNGQVSAFLRSSARCAPSPCRSDAGSMTRITNSAVASASSAANDAQPVSRRPAVGNTILLNGIHFEVIAMLSMIGNEEQNSTNIRIFVPFNTMRELFPLKGDTRRRQRDFVHHYQPRTFDENEAAKDELHAIVARNHGGFDPKAKDVWKSGIR